jgi:hypothetical protein
MQAIIVIGLTGFIYATIASMVAAVFTSALEYRERSIAQLEQMFEDVDFAVNNVILQQQVDLTLFPELSSNANDLSELATYTTWSVDELTMDPWESPIQIRAQLAPAALSTVYVDDSTGSGDPIFDNLVIAPIWAFALISPGPDRNLDTPIPLVPNYRQILNLEPAAGSDDIIHTFSTQKTMFSIWNEMYFEIEHRMLPAIVDVYKQRQAAFQPVINFAYNELLAIANPGEAIMFVDSWQTYGDDRVAAITPAPVASANMLVYSTKAVSDTAVVPGAVPPDGDSRAHPTLGGSFFYPDISTMGVEHVGLDGVTLQWEPFFLTMQSIVSDFWALGTPIGDEQAVADEALKVHITLDSLVGTGGLPAEEWQLDFNLVASGTED